MRSTSRSKSLRVEGPCVVFDVVEMCSVASQPLGGASFRVVADSKRTRILCSVADAYGRYRVKRSRPARAGDLLVDVYLGWSGCSAFINDLPGGAPMGYLFGNSTNGFRTPRQTHLATPRWAAADAFECKHRSGAWARTQKNATGRFEWWQQKWHWEKDSCMAADGDGGESSSNRGGRGGRGGRSSASSGSVSSSGSSSSGSGGSSGGGSSSGDLLCSGVTSVDFVGESRLKYIEECLMATLYAGRAHAAEPKHEPMHAPRATAGNSSGKKAAALNHTARALPSLAEDGFDGVLARAAGLAVESWASCGLPAREIEMI